jgi:hypothetical protein
MQEVINIILSQLPNVGDRKLYADVYAAIPAELHRHVRNATQTLKAQGVVVPENTYDNGKFTHELVRAKVS